VHLFGHNRDHDYYFELPREGERDTQFTKVYSGVKADISYGINFTGNGEWESLN
jgi:hypothetical protein